ncbi:MAG: STT3 domain-containing protein, partial [archaeon]
MEHSDNQDNKSGNKPEHKKDHKSAEQEGEEMKFDLTRVKHFFSKMTMSKANYALLIILLLLIPVCLTVYIRLQPQYLSQTDSWASGSVNNYFRGQITDSVNAQYPNLPQQNKDALITQQFTEFAKNNQQVLDQQIESTSQFFKSGFRYEENNVTYTFLGDLDSYFFLRQAKNILDKGMVCDAIIGGVCMDTYKVAPIGDPAAPSLHPYGIAYLYKFLKIFNPNTTLMRAAFLLPTILAVLCAIAVFFVGKRIMNVTAGFIASMLLSLSPMFLSRTLGSDTDIWNVLFPILIVWAFLEAFEAKSLVKRLSFSGIAGLLMGIFAYSWGAGWWYIFDLIIVAVVGYLAFITIRNYIHHKSFKKIFDANMKSALLVIGALILSTMVFVSIFSSFAVFRAAFTDPIVRFTTSKVATNTNLWPNVITTVAEMNDASIADVVAQASFGFNALFALSLLGIIFLLVRREPKLKDYLIILGSAIVFFFLISSSALALNPFIYLAILMIPLLAAILLLLLDKDSNVDIKPAILLTVWFVGMILASTKGVRFILLVIPTFAISLGVAIGYLYQYINRVFEKEFNLDKTKAAISAVVIFLVIACFLFMPFTSSMPRLGLGIGAIGVSTGSSFTPSMTRGWWDSLTKIRLESKPDAIINSWWDFGHWFKYVADRRVTLDGASQNHPGAHWLGRILQTSNEDESVAILRMLDCGSNSAYDEINRKFQDTEKSQNIVSDLIMMSKAKAGERLAAYGFTKEESDKVLSLTHCDPPEDFFITSEDMVGKAGVWAHFGLWDFDKSFIVNNVVNKNFEEGTKLMMDRWNYTEDQAATIYY